MEGKSLCCDFRINKMDSTLGGGGSFSGQSTGGVGKHQREGSKNGDFYFHNMK